jgi:hypothetical protein
MPAKRDNPLAVENRKLRKALAGLIPWAGSLPEGPEWATAEAKQRNRAMFEKAIAEAFDCFPEDYDNLSEVTEAN